ncbi:uncharacterized protein LOC102151680 [Canis lupus familiaris]|uniref:uncharacterized protein LOC102151680 n=1 Tax=Canis lupus familiaris TaxID=9615 RepID=UPI0018F3125D|nr:uncharacterized protein LOC102151680 [Canis lupus familiaris]
MAKDLVGLDACTPKGRTCGWRYALQVTPASKVIDMRPSGLGRRGEAPARNPFPHRQDADHPRRAQRFSGKTRGKTGQSCLNPGCARRGPLGAHSPSLGPVDRGVVVSLCAQAFACREGGRRQHERCPCSFLQEWVREGVPGSEVTAVSQSPTELGTPVTRHPHPVQPQLGLTWLETSATGGCSLAAGPRLGALAPRNPRGAACSYAVGSGSSIGPKGVQGGDQEAPSELHPGRGARAGGRGRLPHRLQEQGGALRSYQRPARAQGCRGRGLEGASDRPDQAHPEGAAGVQSPTTAARLAAQGRHLSSAF